MLEVLTTWSKPRLFWTIALCYAVIAEILSLSLLDASPCIVEHINGVCPSLHMFTFHKASLILKKSAEGNAFTVLTTVAAIIFIWEFVLWLCADDKGPDQTSVDYAQGDSAIGEGESDDHNERNGGRNPFNPGPITRFLKLEPIVQFTAVLALIGVLQWQTLEKTDQTLRLQSRAWIAPRGLVTPEKFKAAINEYTEVTLRLENIGKEPAINTAEVVGTEALPIDDFRNEEVLGAIIQKMLDGRTCDSIPINPNGRAIFPGGTPAIVVGFEEEKVIKINKRTHYALVAGCFVYETMNETHRTRFCGILEPPAASKDWRSDTCPIHNDAQ